MQKRYENLKLRLEHLGVGRDQLWLLQAHNMLIKKPPKSGIYTTDGANVWYTNLLQLLRTLDTLEL